MELYNSNAFAVDLSGWQIDDQADGAAPYTIPKGSLIPAKGLFLIERHFGLNNSGDQVRLFAPDGTLRDEHVFMNAYRGIPWSRMGDGNPIWTDKYPRTPGQSNRPAKLTLRGRLYQGHPPDKTNSIMAHYIGLYGGDDPDHPTQWLANAFTQTDGSYSLTYDTSQGLYRFYTLRPSPLQGYEWTGAHSVHGETPARDRIRFRGLPTGDYADNDFWMAPLPTPMHTQTPTPTSTTSPTSGPSPTPTRTTTMTPAPTPASFNFVVINEFLPSPRTIDFDGDGDANHLDEYIEL
ncbi:MAG: lamin tail domain-containing protein, partial [Chloroflexi bacterium]|nr:lamin tail domain-containing protein [Chloroflexota bacterium]